MKRLVILLIGLSYFSVCVAQPLDKSTNPDFKSFVLENDNAKINYSVGYQIGGDFKHQNVEMNAQALVKGIEDALNKTTPLLSKPQMRTTLVDLKKKIIALQKVQKEKQQKLFLDEGIKFLKENGQKRDVTTLASGLQYKVLKSGNGKKPKPSDTVSVHYRGTLIDGTEFDSSMTEDRPAQFRVDNVIAGWTEALQLMQEGDQWQLFVPPDLGYGERGPLADRTLVFDIELIEVN